MRSQTWIRTPGPDHFERILSEEELAGPANVLVPEADGLIPGDLLLLGRGRPADHGGILGTRHVPENRQFMLRLQTWVCAIVEKLVNTVRSECKFLFGFNNRLVSEN